MQKKYIFLIFLKLIKKINETLNLLVKLTIKFIKKRL